MFEFLKNLSPVIMIVMLILVFFSAVSWSIIIYKLVVINRIKKNNKNFVDLFWEVKDFKKINEKVVDCKYCPVALVFREGYKEAEVFLHIHETNKKKKILTADLSAIDNISRSLRKITSLEIDKLERDITFLATTGSTTPFIGLFGTVWGIMRAFKSIGESGSTSLAIVAPGISEALITTAVGLAVAIPAVIGFNYIQNKIKLIINEIDNFSNDFLNIVQKLFNTKK
jgi:biopolymer transport protein TolQ